MPNAWTLPGRSIGNGALMELYSCTGAADQGWTARCFDIPGGITTDGVQPDIEDCTGGSY